MAFFEHLDELRRRLAIIVFVLFGGALGLYYWGLDIYVLAMRPVMANFPEGTDLLAFGPFELFTIRFKVAAFAAAVVTSPVWIYQLMAFFLPALKPKERRWFVPIFLAMVVFFVGGVLTCWIMVLEPGFAWLLAQGGDTIMIAPRASEFFQGAVLFMIGFGVGFQTPIVVFGLIVLGIVPYEKMRENWRVAYVVLMIVASVATPDWSYVTMLSLFAAMLVLYEGSLLVSRIVLRKRIAAAKAAEVI